jgi:hypothetical protein
VTAHRDRLATILAEIDAVLEDSGPRLPWVMANDVQGQRQTLARARELLIQLQQSLDDATPSNGQDLVPSSTPTMAHSIADSDPTAQASSQVLQALLQEMQYLRGQTMQILDPLRNEVATLKQQRELLLQEVQHLQQQRLQLDADNSPNLEISQWEDLRQQLTQHLETQLSQQLQQSVQQLETSAANTYLLSQGADSEGQNSAELSPTQRLEYLKRIQTQSDQLVMHLDRVLQTVFESLEKSVESYQASLSQGLNKMHTLGQQGEMMFTALINHLAQQMNQDALTYLESSRASGGQPRQLPDAALGESLTQPAGKNPQPSSAPTSTDRDPALDFDDLEDLDLDLALYDDEVTLLQIDEDISQLQFDIDQLPIDPLSTEGDFAQTADRASESAQNPATAGAPQESDSALAFDPLQVLDQLDEAAPTPIPSVSLPDSPQSDTLDAAVVADADVPEDAENSLNDLYQDELYQSIFGDVLEANQSQPQTQTSDATESSSMATSSSQSSSPVSGDHEEPHDAISSPETSARADLGDLPLDDMAALLDSSPADPEPSTPRAVENDDQTSLDELFGDGTAEQLSDTASAPPETASTDTITSLGELLPESRPAFVESSESLIGEGEDGGLDNLGNRLWSSSTDFIPANQEEDLLASDELPQPNDYWLTVDQEIVDQLDADLANLEAGGAGSAPPEPDELNYDLTNASPLAGAVFSSPEPAPDPAESDIAASRTAPAGIETVGEEPQPFSEPPSEPEDVVSVAGGFASFDAPPVDEFSPAEPRESSAISFGEGDEVSLPPPPPTSETVEDAFESFGDSRFAVDAPADLDEPFTSNPPIPASGPENNPWQDEIKPTVEDNRMPIGDLPSQETVEALFSELKLDLDPDEPAVGESGFTLEALESLASTPAPPNQPEARPVSPPPLPAEADTPQSSAHSAGENSVQDSYSFNDSSINPQALENRATPPQPVGNGDQESSLTLENLVGELKLDPLFPEQREDDSLPPVTAENIFQDFGENRANNRFNETLPAEPAPMDASDQGIDLFSDAPQPEPTSGDLPDAGINLFGEVSQAEPAPADSPNDAIDLFSEVPPAEPAPAEAQDQGIDLFGEVPPAEPAPAEAQDQGIDLFGEVPLSEPAPVEVQDQGIDLFGEVPSSESASVEAQDQGIDLFDAPSTPGLGSVSSQAEGINLFGEPPPAESAPMGSHEEGLDLFGEAPSAETASVDFSSEGLDLFDGLSSDLTAQSGANYQAVDDDLPPISLEDLDLSLDAPPLEEPLSTNEGYSQTEADVTADNLFGLDPGDADLSPSSDSDRAEDLLGNSPASIDREDIEAEEGSTSGFTLNQPLEDSDQTLESLDVDLFGAMDAASAAAQDLVDSSTPEADQPETKYTEWLSDISLENILGTGSLQGSEAPTPGPELSEQNAEGEISTPARESGSTDDDLTDLALNPVEAEPSPQLNDGGFDYSAPQAIDPAEDLTDAFAEQAVFAEDEQSLEADEIEQETANAVPTLPEQDMLNLDALLEASLGRAAVQPSDQDDSPELEGEAELTQDFDSEIDFIDLDSLLEAPGAAAPGVPPGLVDEDEGFAIGDEGSVLELSDDTAQSGIPDASQWIQDMPLDQIAALEQTPDATMGVNDIEWVEEAETISEDSDDGVEIQETPEPTIAAPDAGTAPLPDDLEEATSDGREPAYPVDRAEGDIENIETAIVGQLQDSEAVGGAVSSLEAIPLSATIESLHSPDETEPAPPELTLPPETDDDTHDLWFLGLDIGAQGISAVLLRRLTGQVFPLFWVDTTISGATADKFFRLPTLASVGPAATGYGIQAVGSSALMVNWEDSETPDDDTILVKALKPFLKMGLPVNDPTSFEAQPLIQWSEQVQMPLQTFETALQELLTTLLPLTPSRSHLTVGAIGLPTEEIMAALQQLQGVVVSYPANWPDTYPFNVREAILKAGLVERADDIYFLEDAIAAVLSGLPDPAEPPPSTNGQPVQQQTLYACHWSGGTVVLSAGATVTEMALANLPESLGDLSYQDFALHSMAYAGDAMDLDMICHLLHPPERRQPRNLERYRGPSDPEGWGWQAAMPELDAAHWDDLDLDSLDFPRVAEPDLGRRYRLQQRLESSLLGQSLLEAVRHLKIILQHQPQFELELADQRWIVRSKDLEDRIILPYIQRINGHLNKLLSEVGLSTQGINQVICTGGSASLPKISRWLRQKFPNATIIQDTYHSDRPPSCSRVAYGLVNLMRYPEVLDRTRHQYSDMFLLMELLRTLPDQPMPLSGILHLLQERGINTEACELHLIALLEGRLPPGLLPATNNPYVKAPSEDDSNLQALLTTPLFSRPNNQVYVPNPEQCQRLLTYMTSLLADKRQTLADPLLIELSTIPA